ncbi:MAG TPA: hypothetical protein VKX28_22770 [Xanthobacteraceae bacterium]|nr:hypothetical protein [Xanthobacteraceae bacterium]
MQSIWDLLPASLSANAFSPLAGGFGNLAGPSSSQAPDPAPPASDGDQASASGGILGAAFGASTPGGILGPVFGASAAAPPVTSLSNLPSPSWLPPFVPATPIAGHANPQPRPSSAALARPQASSASNAAPLLVAPANQLGSTLGAVTNGQSASALPEVTDIGSGAADGPMDMSRSAAFPEISNGRSLLSRFTKAASGASPFPGQQNPIGNWIGNLASTSGPTLDADPFSPVAVPIRIDLSPNPNQRNPFGALAAPAQSDDGASTTGLNEVAGGPTPIGKVFDAEYAQSYAQAQAAIASDSELRTAVRMAENAGNMGFKDRLATIIADLKHRPQTALQTINDERFAKQVRAGGMAGTDMVDNWATQKAMDRLDELYPRQGIWQASYAGYRKAVDLSEQQRNLLHIISADPRLSPSERIDRMVQSGLFDVALASALSGLPGFANRGGGPTAPNEPDALATPTRRGQRPVESFRPKIDKIIEEEESSARARAAPDLSSEPAGLTVGRSELEDFRARIGVPTRETVAVARTNVPGLEGWTGGGGSSLVYDKARLSRPMPHPVRSPSRSPRYQGHAEEDVINQFIEEVEKRGLQPSDLYGRKLVIHISNPRGVCGVCLWGFDSKRPPGVFKQLTDRYRGLTIIVSVKTEPGIVSRSPTRFEIRGGEIISRSYQ